MAVIQRTNYLEDSKCDALVAALPTMRFAHGRGLRKSIDGGNKVSVYQHTRWQWYPESLKTAFTLRESEGKSYEEISIITNTPIGTVRSRIFRARESIIEYMKKELINRE